MTKIAWLVALGAWALVAQTPPYTRITDTLPPGTSGKAVSGTLNASWTLFTYSGATVAQSPISGVNFPITTGAVSVSLAPTDHAAGCPTHCPAYQITTNVSGNQVTTYWSVPTLPSVQCAHSTYCTISEVTVAYPPNPPLAINLAQLNLSGYADGTYCVQVVGGVAVLTQAGCGGGGGSGISWGALTSGAWSSLTSGQWAALTN